MSTSIPTEIEEALRPLLRSLHNLELLANQVKTGGGIVPFVGAGMSAPYRFKGWGAFLLEHAETYGVKSDVEAMLDKGLYEEAAQLLRDNMGRRDFDNLLPVTFGRKRLPNPMPVGTAVTYLPALAPGPVLTTNYDPVIETVFRSDGRDFEHIVWGAKADIVSRSYRQDMRLLVKLHGDADDSTDRVLTKDDYDRAYGDPNGPLPKLLRMIFSAQRPLLFLGCSLEGDRTVSILKDAADNFPAIEHYALMEAPEDRAKLVVRNRDLGDLGVVVVWFPHGRFDLIPRILNFLAGAPSTSGHATSTSTALAQAPSAASRMALFTKLSSLLSQQFSQLEFALSPPRGTMPGTNAPVADRVAALLQWAEAPGGVGLEVVGACYDEIVGTH